jgi:cytochrome P450
LLHGVIEETLRLYPPVPITLRLAANDTTMQGHLIPKGTRVALDFYALNRITRAWGADSEAFIPERWIDEESQKKRLFDRQGQSHLSFYWGKHHCIGIEVGRAEMRCAIAGLIGRFGIDLVHPNFELKEAGMIGQRPVDKIYLNLTAIEGW